MGQMPNPDGIDIRVDTRCEIAHRGEDRLIADKRVKFNDDIPSVEITYIIIEIRLNQHFTPRLPNGRRHTDITD